MVIGVFVVLAFWIYAFVFLRSFFYGIKRYQLNNSAIKKRAKEGTVKEWLIYSKYRDVIPKTLIIIYYLIFTIHGGAFIICCVLSFIESLHNIIRVIALSIVGFDVIWGISLKLIFWNSGPDWAFERWISKKRGMKSVKKKDAKGR